MRGKSPVVSAGERFGRLTVVGEAAPSAAGKRRYHCVCDCGKEHTTLGASLSGGARRVAGASAGSARASVDA
jgi:hypothetical protein